MAVSTPSTGLTHSPPGGPASRSAAGGLRLRAAVFIAGAAVMVLEILGTRIISPHFGAGLHVWAALITVTLVALALGYWAGGVLADRRPSAVWLAGVLLASAAAVAVLPLTRGPVLELSWSLGIRGGAVFASTVLFLPPLLLLGMVSPYAIRLEATDVLAVGRSAGRLAAISTAGSVAGAVLAGFVLVPAFRVPTVLAIIAIALAVAAVIAATPGINARVAGCAVAVAGGAVWLAWPRAMPPGLLAVRRHADSDIRVVEHEGSRFLLLNQTVQSSIDPQGRTLDRYEYFLAGRMLLARPAARRAAIVGLGGGCIVPLLERYGITVDAVEISPEIIELAREYFALSLPPERVHAMDGRLFLKSHSGTFDFVVLDGFGGDHLAASLVSREGLAEARKALVRGGVLAINTVAIDTSTGGPNRVASAIRATLAQVFPHVLAVPAAGNLLFFASDEPVEPGREAIEFDTFDGPRTFRWLDVPPAEWPLAPVLNDDWNPIDVLEVADVEVSRFRRREAFPAAVRAAIAWE